MVEVSDVLTILTVALGVMGSIWGSIRWLISLSEKNIKDLRDSMQTTMSTQHEDHKEDITGLHERINEIRDQYVKRVDLDRDLTNIYGMLNSIKEDIRGQTDAMNQRLDRLINVFADKNRSD